MNQQEVTLDEMIEYGEHAIAAGPPFENRAFEIQKAIIDTLKGLRNTKSALLPIEPPLNQHVIENEIGEIIRKKVDLESRLEIGGLDAHSMSKIVQELNWINRQYRQLKEQHKYCLLQRITLIDEELKSRFDLVAVDELKELRQIIFKKIAAIDNELKSLAA